MKKHLLKILLLVFSSTLVLLSSCGDDDDPAPVAPELSIDVETFAGDIGDQVTAVVSGNLEGDFVVLRVSKFIGNNPDTNFGNNGVDEVTSGLPYTFNFTLGIEGLTDPIRFNFEVEDSNGLTDDVNLVITTNASNEQLLVSFNWRWADQVFEGESTIEDCEADNVYSFESDGSMSLDFGALTGSGGGSCDFDGVLTYDGWDMNDAMDTLRVFRGDAFTGNPNDTIVYAITSFDQTAFTADETNLFGIFSWTYQAQAKD